MAEMRYMISDVSRILDIPANVLRYLEYHLSLNIKRTEVGHRYYLQEDVDMLRSVKVLRDKGFHLKIIKSILPYIDKVVALEPERLEDMRIRMEAALGLSGIEALEKTRAQYGKAIDISLEDDDFLVRQPSTNQVIRLNTKGAEPEHEKTSQENRPEIKVVKPESRAKKMSAEELPRSKETSSGKKETTQGKLAVPKKAEVQTKIDKSDLDKKQLSNEKEEGQIIAASEDEMLDEPQFKPVLDKKQDNTILRENQDKIIQFREIMCSIVMDALKQNNHTLSNDINETVTQSIVKEMDYMMKAKEERQEERFRQLDRAIRETQLQRQQAAASKEEKRKRRSKFFRKHNVRI